MSVKQNIKTFEKQGYVLVKNALSKEVTDLVTQYTLFDEGNDLQLEEGPTPQIHNSHSQYADPLMESLLLKLHKTLEENTGLTLYPTYSYYRVYRPGAVLVPHKDRASCEISATVTLGYDYKDQNGSYEWPIFMEGTGYSMNPGDIVIYRGCDMEHWRDEFIAPEGSYHSQVFVHYVDANGPYADYKWDGRPAIGFDPKIKERFCKMNPLYTDKPYISYT